jgi:hypothetical protein
MTEQDETSKKEQKKQKKSKENWISLGFNAEIRIPKNIHNLKENCICGWNIFNWRAVARRASEHVEVTNVPSKNPKADHLDDRGVTISATKNIY